MRAEAVCMPEKGGTSSPPMPKEISSSRSSAVSPSKPGEDRLTAWTRAGSWTAWSSSSLATGAGRVRTHSRSSTPAAPARIRVSVSRIGAIGW